MKNKPLVSVIIVNWNGEQYLKKCLPSLDEQTYKNIETILVDNSSEDNSIEYAKSRFPKIKIILNKRNYGFAKANNIGYLKSKGEYILFLNNDTEVTKNFISEMLKVFYNDKENQIGGIQSRILLMDSLGKLDSVGAYLTNTGFLYHYGIAKKYTKKYHKTIPIYSAKGACMLFRREVLDKIAVNNELFDGKYFAYFEETDMCHRVWLSGNKIIFCPESIIYHKTGGTSQRMNNDLIQYHSFKNRINSYIKNFGTLNLITILPLHLMLCEFYAIFSLSTFKIKIFIAIQKGIFWNITNFNATLKKRKYIQEKIRKKSDAELDKIIKRRVRLSYYFYILSDLGKYED